MFQTGVSRMLMLPMNTRPQRAEPRAISLFPAGSAVAQGIVARMGEDSPAGSSQDDQNPVPALTGCAIASAASCSPAKVFGNLNP